MKTTKLSVTIPNLSSYEFRLELDDIKGIIRLTKNKITGPFTKITNRNIPIETSKKWEFYNSRTGYAEKDSTYGFIGSYIDRSIEPEKYNNWRSFITQTYQIYKNLYGEK